MVNKKGVLVLVLIVLSSFVYAQGWESGDYYARIVYEPVSQMIFTQHVVLESSKEESPTAIFTLKNANDAADDFEDDDVATITLAEGNLLNSELQILISVDGCKFEDYNDRLCKPTDTTQLEENIDSLNGLMDQAPGMVKSIFGNERMNFYILEKPMLTFNVITSDGIITEIGGTELENPTMVVLIKKGTLKQIREKKLTPMDALDNGKIEYKGVGFLKKIKAGILNLGLKIFSLFSGREAPPPVDSDGDGINDDADDCPYEYGVADNNGCPAVIDSDGDGIEDLFDLCPNVFGPVENNGCPLADSDGDGVPDDVDNCPSHFNPNQEDIDGDMVGDACEIGPPIAADQDGDGVPDDVDNCPAHFNPNQEDIDGDMVGDACEIGPPIADSDGDGFPDDVDQCPTTPGIVNGCPAAQCADGVLDPGEQCDDGNTMNGDGCADDCTIEPGYPGYIAPCGNAVLDAGEQCDDGNTINGDGCADDCTIEPGYPGYIAPCGDGIVDVALGEMCDDGNLADGDGCSSTCVTEICGNGVLNAGEQCDDGNLADGDGCSAQCTIEPGYS
jgi:cysteine-rich repeat protein